jgi:hypothetical protein
MPLLVVWTKRKSSVRKEQLLKVGDYKELLSRKFSDAHRADLLS